MAGKIYLNLLILCGILCQGIMSTLSNENREKSSAILARKRRVINHLVGGLTPTPIEQAKYTVNIKKDRRAYCVGVILSHYSVLTSATCLLYPETQYQIFSGSGIDHRSKIHNITSKAVFSGHSPYQGYDGIALVTVDPPFTFSQKTGSIELHQGPLPAGTRVKVFGWGCSYPPQPAPLGMRRRLRSITISIMNHAECENEYRSSYRITEKYFCTFDEQQYCAVTDTGAPLVFNDKLVGIHAFKKERWGRRNPDVFVNLQLPEYNAWIREHTLLM